MILDVMTYNIESWVKSENGKLKPREIPENLFKYINGYFRKSSNAIAVLQEVRYKDSYNPQEIIQQENIVNGNSCELLHPIVGYANSGTVIISKLTNATISLTTIEPEPERKNKMIGAVIECEDKKLSFLGIHLTNEVKEQLESLDELKLKLGDLIEPDIILGDFNAGDYPKCENRETFKSTLKDYVCICNMPTRVIGKEYGARCGENTCIDHVFVKPEKVINCSSLIVHEEISFSDHYPITFKIEL